jgi:hypothetical protein
MVCATSIPGNAPNIFEAKANGRTIEDAPLIPALVHQRDQARAERDEARKLAELACEQHNALLAAHVLTCAFCGEAYPDGTPETKHELLTTHVKMCAAHPMREVEAERDAERQRKGAAIACAELRGKWAHHNGDDEGADELTRADALLALAKGESNG